MIIWIDYRKVGGQVESRVIKWFDYRKVGGQLESRVIKWFDYLWSNKNSMDEESVLAMLPEKLKVSIERHGT